VFCGIFLLCSGTIAADAATNGGIQRLFGLKDSVGIGAANTEFVHKEPEAGQNDGYSMELRRAEDGTVTTVIKAVVDEPMFSCYISAVDNDWNYQISTSLKHCVTKEEFAWKIYAQLVQVFESVRANKTMCNEIADELEKVKKEAGTGTDLQDGCVLGMQFMIDDLRKHSGMVKIVETVLYDFQDVDDDGDREEVLGLSFLKLDFEAMKFETEKTGKKEFEVETAAGISGRYCVKVEMYEPTLIYHCEPMN